jgi:hypothetical protein
MTSTLDLEVAVVRRKPPIDDLMQVYEVVPEPEANRCLVAAIAGVAVDVNREYVVAHVPEAHVHWTVAGADAIIALRCCKLSGRFEDFWERRAAA